MASQPLRYAEPAIAHRRSNAGKFNVSPHLFAADLLCDAVLLLAHLHIV